MLMQSDWVLQRGGKRQSQQTRPGGQPVVRQFGLVHPVVSDPGGQHCTAVVMISAAERLAYSPYMLKGLAVLANVASAVNPGNLITDLLACSKRSPLDMSTF